MAKVLFVDDEPRIRETLPQILRTRNYQVTVAATVAEALNALASEPFDLLISDLNIGQPGDGFTVVSAMRRTHPECINIILTGFPGFDSALKAIREQVDDYIVKPANIPSLFALLEQHLDMRTPHHQPIVKPVAQILKENRDEIVRHTLNGMKWHPLLRAIPLSDQERCFPLPVVLDEIVLQLESSARNEIVTGTLEGAARYGRWRRKQNYPMEGVVADANLAQNAIFEVIHANLLCLDLSTLFEDLKRINDYIHDRLSEALKAYVDFDRKAA